MLANCVTGQQYFFFVTKNFFNEEHETRGETIPMTFHENNSTFQHKTCKAIVYVERRFHGRENTRHHAADLFPWSRCLPATSSTGHTSADNVRHPNFSTMYTFFLPPFSSLFFFYLRRCMQMCHAISP